LNLLTLEGTKLPLLLQGISLLLVVSEVRLKVLEFLERFIFFCMRSVQQLW